jgi:hypothetical protein
MIPSSTHFLEVVMEDFGTLMQRLLEIQSGGRQRSPKLMAEDKRLMADLQKKYLAAKPPKTELLGQQGPEQA